MTITADAPPAGRTLTPPQDADAERCVLGAMLLSKDAITAVVEHVRVYDFYLPKHTVIFRAILNLWEAGDPADAITVADALTRTRDLERAGGAVYLSNLLADLPNVGSATYYAKIVADRAMLRRVADAGARLTQIGNAPDRHGNDVAEEALRIVHDATTHRAVGQVFSPLMDLLQGALDEIEAASTSDGRRGLATGFTDLDRLLAGGLTAGQLVVVAGRPGMGKALALDTPLPTPTGWTTMADVRPGDQLLDAHGRPTTVTATSPVMTDRSCLEVVFSDGSVIVADADHRWLTHTRASRRSGGPAQVRTTAEIAETVRCATQDGRANHSVTNAQALQLAPAELPMPPYTFGVWLGDGHSAAGSTARRCTDCQHRHGSLLPTLRTMNVLNNKHIPMTYLRASEDQRRALLAGLLDTDGTVTNAGVVQFAVTSRRLALDARELIISLGYRCTIATKAVRGRRPESSISYQVNFTTIDDVFRLPRKVQAHRSRRRSTNTVRIAMRYITDVRPVRSVAVRCVSVDNPDHLYLAGHTMIPTHNSTLGVDVLRHVAIKMGVPAAIISLEMDKTELVTRILSAEARIPLTVLKTGQLSDNEWTTLARRMGEISEAPMYVSDVPDMSLVEIRAQALRLKQEHDIQLIVVDYLSLMHSGKIAENRQQEVSLLTRGCKLLAKLLKIPFILIAQLNRNVEGRTDKRPQLSDLRESGSVEQDADIVILLHRDDYYDKESARAGEADFIVAKHRGGPTDTVTVAAQLHLCRFVDMAI